MENIATIPFTDLDSKDEAYAMIRAEAGIIGLALTLRTDGDIAVFMDLQTCRELIRALTHAEQLASSSQSA